MKKQRNHNEYFMPLAKKLKSHDGVMHDHRTKHEVPDRQLYAWGEYSRTGRWNTIEHFCQACWPFIKAKLKTHTGPCGCTVTLIARSGHSIPDWITLE